MGELVHDIVPGAAMAFGSAFIGSQAGFATNITKLCSAPVNATVMVDDVISFAEPMYQDGIVAQAAATCVASGVPYYSSAGNEANRGFKQAFVDINTSVDDQAVPPTGNDLHQWRTCWRCSRNCRLHQYHRRCSNRLCGRGTLQRQPTQRSLPCRHPLTWPSPIPIRPTR